LFYRNNLFGTDGKGTTTRKWGVRQETPETQNLTNDQLLQQQQKTMEGNADDVLHALIKLKSKIKFLIYLEKVLQEQKKLPMLLETKQVQIHLCA
jgi:hypothetical protein